MARGDAIERSAREAVAAKATQDRAKGVAELSRESARRDPASSNSPPVDARVARGQRDHRANALRMRAAARPRSRREFRYGPLWPRALSCTILSRPPSRAARR